jgi:nicotinamide-nucleotide amidase
VYTCSLLAVGDELLDGRVHDTNSDFITEKLDIIGMRVALRIIAGDDMELIGSALRMALQVSDAVLITGGLGPTEDDLTREAVARALGLSVRRDMRLAEDLRSFFNAMGREMSETNLKQADLVEGAFPIAARLGTAPGQWLEKGGKLVILVPGVPREMRDMVDGDVVPLLLERYTAGRRRRTLSLIVAARPESELAEQVQAALSGISGIGVSYRAMMGQIEVRLWTRDEDASLEGAEKVVRGALGPWVVAEGEETLEGNLGRELISRGLTLAVAESLTGGMVGERITRVTGSSEYFKGGVIAYTYDAKVKLLGVDGDLLRSRGAVCSEVVEAMARGAMEMFSSHIGIALSGVAGPESGEEREPPGTVAFGMADDAGSYSWKYRLPGDREMVREFATTVMLTIAYFRARGEDVSHVR